MKNEWSRKEVELIVFDYFEMLEKELRQLKYSKSQHRAALLSILSNRSNGSIEFKHQNISAVLQNMGIPFIDGYKPRTNIQKSLLPEVVAACWAQKSHLRKFMLESIDSVGKAPLIPNILSILEKAPRRELNTEQVREIRGEYRNSINFFQREAENQMLGDLGEKCVIEFERARLKALGKETLAEKVKHVAVEVGPQAGFDILSFEEDGTERFIEVKTTRYGKYTPFYVTENERRFAEDNHQQYHLYRLHKFYAAPKLFCLEGKLSDYSELLPVTYRAYLM